MIVYAALAPSRSSSFDAHDDNAMEISSGFRAAAENLYTRQPGTLIVISASEHAPRYHPCSLSLAPQSVGDRDFAPDHDTATACQALTERSGLLLMSADTLNHSHALTIARLIGPLPATRMLLFVTSIAKPEMHFVLGQTLQDVLMNAPTRCAILAVVPPIRTEFHTTILHALERRDTAGLLPLHTSQDEQTLQPLMMLLGILHGQGFRSRLLTNESSAHGNAALVEFLPNAL